LDALARAIGSTRGRESAGARVIGSGDGGGSSGWAHAVTWTSSAVIRAPSGRADGRERGRARISPVFITTYLLGCQQSAFEQARRAAHVLDGSCTLRILDAVSGHLSHRASAMPSEERRPIGYLCICEVAQAKRMCPRSATSEVCGVAQI